MNYHKASLILVSSVFLISPVSADIIFDDPDPVQFKTDLNMNQNDAFNFTEPDESRDPVIVSYADDNYLNDDNDKLEGYLDINGKELRNFFQDKCQSGEAVTRVKEDGSYSCLGVLNEGGDTLEGNLIINGNDLETGGQAIELTDGSQNILVVRDDGSISIPNGNIEVEGNTDGIDLDNPSNGLSASGSQYNIISDAIGDNELNNTQELTINGLKSNSNIDLTGENLTSVKNIQFQSGASINGTIDTEGENVNLDNGSLTGLKSIEGEDNTVIVKDNLNMDGNLIKNLDWSNAGDLDSNGDISDGNVENAELSNSQFGVSGGEGVNGNQNIELGNNAAISIVWSDANNLNANGGISDFSNSDDLDSAGDISGLSDVNTDDLSEGSSNLYYLASRARSDVRAQDVNLENLRNVDQANTDGAYLVYDTNNDDFNVQLGSELTGDGSGNIVVNEDNVNINELENSGDLADESSVSQSQIDSNSVGNSELDNSVNVDLGTLDVSGGSAGDGSQSGLTVDNNGNLYFSGSLNFPGDVNTVSQQELDGSFVPSQDATFNLGGSSDKWKNAYLSGSLVMGSTDLTESDLDALNNGVINDGELSNSITVGSGGDVDGRSLSSDNTIDTGSDSISVNEGNIDADRVDGNDASNLCQSDGTNCPTDNTGTDDQNINSFTGSGDKVTLDLENGGSSSATIDDDYDPNSDASTECSGDDYLAGDGACNSDSYDPNSNTQLDDTGASSDVDMNNNDINNPGCIGDYC